MIIIIIINNNIVVSVRFFNPICRNSNMPPKKKKKKKNIYIYTYIYIYIHGVFQLEQLNGIWLILRQINLSWVILCLTVRELHSFYIHTYDFYVVVS